MKPFSPAVNDIPGAPPLELFMGRSSIMRTLMDTLRAVSPTTIPVLIQGESGTGKELCVQWLHHLAHQRRDSLVKVSCPAIPHALLESELFGYEKGAFTGANTTRRGRVEQAENGTLFLDEIGNLHLSMQSKLLRFLQDGTFSRVGGHDLQQVQTRLVCTANRDLKQQVAEGSFRLDLLYRINTVCLTMPPLRERPEDIPALANHFLHQHATEFGTRPAPIPREILQHLCGYSWPGNIRQLENMVRSYALIGNLDVLIPDDTDLATVTPIDEIDVSSPASLKSITRQATQQLERQIILKVLKVNGWNRRNTAKWLKISYRSLLYKLSAFGNVDELPPPAPMSIKVAPTPQLEPVSRLIRQDR